MNSPTQSRPNPLLKVRLLCREAGATTYKVVEVHNTTKFNPGDLVDDQQLEDLLSTGVRVTVL